jgi:hypothetical protein
VGLVGSAALGAGVFGLWIADAPLPGARALGWIGLGAVVASVLVTPARSPSVRVGPVGVTVGEAGDEQRVAWCDVQSVRIREGRLEIAREGGSLSVPLRSHAAAAARIVAEAALRIGDRVDISPADHERLPKLRDDDATLVPVPTLQLAGRRCLQSGNPITFESDARPCDNCGALYHRSHAPSECQSCSRSLT